MSDSMPAVDGFEKRIRFTEKCTEEHFVRQDKIITELRVKVAMLEAVLKEQEEQLNEIRESFASVWEAFAEKVYAK